MSSILFVHAMWKFALIIIFVEESWIRTISTLNLDNKKMKDIFGIVGYQQNILVMSEIHRTCYLFKLVDIIFI